VPVVIIQPSVLKCNAPPKSEPGFVNISLCYNDQAVQVNPSQSIFEYRRAHDEKSVGKKRIKDPMPPISNDAAD
jgi:hypothetical protein